MSAISKKMILGIPLVILGFLAFMTAGYVVIWGEEWIYAVRQIYNYLFAATLTTVIAVLFVGTPLAYLLNWHKR